MVHKFQHVSAGPAPQPQQPDFAARLSPCRLNGPESASDRCRCRIWPLQRGLPRLQSLKSTHILWDPQQMWSASWCRPAQIV